jgi:serine/threonine protein kinase
VRPARLQRRQPLGLIISTMNKKVSKGSRFGDWIVDATDPLGKGGNGTVWRIVHEGEKVEAALKLLHLHYLEQTSDSFAQRRVARFLQEIRFLRENAGLEGVLPALDSHLPDHPSHDSRPWIVTPLATPLSSANMQGLEPIIAVFASIAKTLASLHARKIYHRDIKPDNLFLLDDKGVVGDFGLVDIPGGAAITVSSEILGPLHYIAPEMMQNAPQSDPARADVYSLAKSMWVVATGQKFPMPGEQRTNVPALTLSAYRAHPRAKILDYLIEQCTRHDPKNRPAMEVVANELRDWTAPLQILGPVPDLSDLAARMRPVFAEILESSVVRKKVSDEFQKELKDLRERFEAMWRDLSKTLDTDRGGVSNGSSRWTDWIAKTNPHSDVIWSDSISISVVFPPKSGILNKKPGSALLSGIGLSLTSNDHVIMTAAHAVGTLPNNCRIIWIEHRSAPASTTQFNIALAQLEDLLCQRIRDAGEAFVELIEATYK